MGIHLSDSAAFAQSTAQPLRAFMDVLSGKSSALPVKTDVYQVGMLVACVWSRLLN
jgi:hypothetical protein